MPRSNVRTEMPMLHSKVGFPLLGRNALTSTQKEALNIGTCADCSSVDGAEVLLRLVQLLEHSDTANAGVNFVLSQIGRSVAHQSIVKCGAFTAAAICTFPCCLFWSIDEGQRYILSLVLGAKHVECCPHDLVSQSLLKSSHTCTKAQSKTEKSQARDRRPIERLRVYRLLQLARAHRGQVILVRVYLS